MCRITAERTQVFRVGIEELKREGNRQRFFAKASGNYHMLHVTCKSQACGENSLSTSKKRNN